MARETALQTALRSSSKERKEEPGYVGDFAGEKKMYSKIKRLLPLKKKTRHLKLMILVLFYV